MSKIQFIQVSPTELANLLKEGLKLNFENLSKQYKESHNSQKEFLTRKETAAFFQVSLVCIHDWCNKGILTPYKMGCRTYFKHSELVTTLLNSNRA